MPTELQFSTSFWSSPKYTLDCVRPLQLSNAVRQPEPDCITVSMNSMDSFVVGHGYVSESLSLSSANTYSTFRLCPSPYNV